MRDTRWTLVVGALAVMACGWIVGAARADDEFDKRASWSPPTVAHVRAELEKWLTTVKLDEAQRQQIVALWPTGEEQLDSQELLERGLDTIGIALPAVKELQATCRGTAPSGGAVKLAILEDTQLPPIVRSNLRLYVGRWLAQNSLYDEALEQLDGLDVSEVFDPAAVLFYQSVAHHRLLDKEKCLPALARLLENEKAIPRRYLTLAKLMEADMKPLKPDSLDEIARLMDDIRRRLDFGRAGTKVRKEEDDVIAKLDKMIEEMEEEMKKQQQQQQAAGGGSSPSSPRPESTPGGMQGPGNVDPKNIGNRSGWGNLPAKQRQEALQQISKDLPAHYRETIEEYFRKLARESNKKSP